MRLNIKSVSHIWEILEFSHIKNFNRKRKFVCNDSLNADKIFQQNILERLRAFFILSIECRKTATIKTVLLTFVTVARVYMYEIRDRLKKITVIKKKSDSQLNDQG